MGIDWLAVFVGPEDHLSPSVVAICGRVLRRTLKMPKGCALVRPTSRTSIATNKCIDWLVTRALLPVPRSYYREKKKV